MLFFIVSFYAGVFQRDLLEYQREEKRESKDLMVSQANPVFRVQWA
jgi:hypothetical protein